ncbi:MAG: hypothetical protein ACOZAR_01550 [Patescibacteria group bacterium]
MPPKANKPIPDELKDVAKTSDIDALEEKLKQKVDKCYSNERFQEFQKDVKNIALEVIDSGDGRSKIKIHAKESAKEYNDEFWWKNISFWIPIIISIITIIFTYISTSSK